MNITMKRVVLIISVALMFVMISASSYAATVTYSASALADQGLTGTRSLKGLATSIGSSKQATIILSHTSSGNTTTYSMSQSVTLTSNITLKIEKGAVLSIAVGKTLTINGTLDAGDYQTFSGSGTVTGLKTCNPYWFGLLADGTDETTTVQTALKATVAGGIITIPNGTRWDYDTIKSDHPDDVIIIDNSGYDWQYNIANSASFRWITKTADAGSKNSHNYIINSALHPAYIVDNLTEHVYGTDSISPYTSFIMRENGRLRWQIGGNYYNDRPHFYIRGRYSFPDWATAETYAAFDTVKESVSGSVYYATETHTSGVFATDLAAGKWVKIPSSGYTMENWIAVIGQKGMPTAIGGVPSLGVKLKVEDQMDREMKVYFRSSANNDLRFFLQAGTSTRWSILSDEDTGILSLNSFLAPQATYTFSPDGKIGASNGTVAFNTSYTAEGTYDFSVDGGAISTINLTEAGVPKNATVKRAWYEVLTPPTSGGAATIALGVSSSDPDGIKTATAYNDAAFSAGYHDGTPDGTAANFTTKTNLDRYLCITIAGAALTAGKIKIFAELLISE